MEDVGREAGYSRDFGDAGFFGDARPSAGAISARRGGAVPGATAIAGPERAGIDPDSADLTGISIAELQALASGRMGIGIAAGAGEPAGGQAAAIARQVADMAQGLAALADKLVGQPQPAPNDVAEADCAAFLESQFRIRRLRARHLPGLSLGEPAWDILLDLAVAQYWHRETSVTSLCIAADVPSTTALRWISGMTKEGVIVRRACQRDGRRSFLAISPAIYQAMLVLAADALRTENRVRARYQRGTA